MPSENQVARALDLIRRGASNYEYFFGNLDNSDWIEPLLAAGFFVNPPAPEPMGEGIIFPSWPESAYLARIARKGDAAAKRVMEVFLAMPATRNPRVHEDMMEAALAMPPKFAARLARRQAEALGEAEYLLWAKPYIRLIRRLLENGQAAAALALCRGVFRLVPPLERDHETLRVAEPSALVDAWQYGEFLRECVADLADYGGLQSLNLVCDLLQQSIEMSGAAGVSDPPRDLSHVWRPAIEESDQNLGGTIKDSLVDGSREIASRLIGRRQVTTDEVVAALISRPWFIFRRLAMYEVRLHPEGAQHLIRDFLTSHDAFDAVTVRHEYVLLLREQYPSLDDEAKATILHWIDRGADPEFVTKYLEDGHTEEQARDLRRRWQRDRLAPIADHLTGAHQARYQDLVSESGEAHHPEFPYFSLGVWIGPTSPKDADDLRSMGPDEVLRFLRDWSPSGLHRSPTAEGLGRVLEPVVAESPDRFSRIAAEFRNVDPTYVRYLFSGFTVALGQGWELEWEPLLGLAEWVIGQPREIPGRDSEFNDLDPGWVWTRKEIARFVAVSMKPDGLPVQFRQRVWGIIEKLAEDPDPGPESVGQRPTEDPTYAANRAINSVRGEAMHAALRYASWVTHADARPTAAGERGLDALPELRRLLENRLNSVVEPSPAIRAVYGQWFPQIAQLDAEWAREWSGRIFSTSGEFRELGLAAWDTYIIFCTVYSFVYEILSPKYVEMVNELEGAAERSDDKGADVHLAQHVMNIYWWGSEGASELVDRLFGCGGSRVRSAAICFGGVCLRDLGASASPEDLERMGSLWQRRLEFAQAADETDDLLDELAEFGGWFAAGAFDAVWSLEKLKETLELTKRASPDHRVLEELGKVPTDLLPTAVECLHLMIRGTDDHWRIAAWEDEITKLLNRARNEGAQPARHAAIALANELCARGFIQYRTLGGARDST